MMSENKKRELKTKNKHKKEKNWKVLYKKALADIVHLEQKMKSELEHAVLLSQRTLLLSLLDVLDDIENIVLTSNQKGKENQAIALVKDKLLNILSTYRVKPIVRNEGDKVDPSKDEIIGVVMGKRDNVIQKVIRKGYEIDRTILRPTRVIVERKEL